MRQKNKILADRILAGLISLLLCLSGMAQRSIFPAQAGQDTTSQVIMIRTEEEFVDFSKSCSVQHFSEGKTFILEADLDLTGMEISPVPLFCGTFDGNGHSIRGIQIQKSGSDLGLFRYIEEGAIVQNLRAEGELSPSGSQKNIGGIAGVNRGKIKNCSFWGTVTGKRATGGIAGHNEETGEIENCRNHAFITGSRMTGGIAGYQEGTILSCTNQGDVNTVPENIVGSEESQETLSLDRDKLMEVLREEKVQDTGGITGMSEGVIRECTNFGRIGYERMGDYTGGIAGRQNGQVIQCRNKGFVCGRRYIGGITGQLEPYLQLLYESDALDQLEQQMDLLSEIQDSFSDSFEQTSDQTSDHLDQVNELSDAVRDITKNHKEDQKSKRDAFRREADRYLDTLEEIIDDMDLDLSSRSARNAASRIRKNISRFKTLLQDLGGIDAAAPSVIPSETPDASSSDWIEYSYSFWIPDEDPDVEGVTDVMMEEWVYSYNIVKELAGCAGSIMQDIEIVLFDGSEGIEDGLQDFADDLDSLRYEGRGLSDLVRDYLDQLLDDLDLLDDELTEKLDALAEEGDTISDILKDGKESFREEKKQLDDVMDQINQIFTDGKNRARKRADDLLDEEDLFEDISDDTWRELSNGMILECQNQGTISGETESGGIVGSIGLKMLEDLKNRMSVDDNHSLNPLKWAKAAVVSCQNNGVIDTRYDYAGGIVGNMNLGTVAGCSNYGMIRSKDGDYVGGIVGSSQHVIRSSCSMGSVSGGSDLGGIAGYGMYLYDNWAMVSISSEDGERLGSVVGSVDQDGILSGNVYVEEGLGANDGISYTSEAMGVAYEELLKLPEIPEAFRNLTVTFLCDEEILDTIQCHYGDSISADQFPKLPEKEGFYHVWDHSDLNNIRNNLQVNAIYCPWISVISTEEEPLAQFLAAGKFYPDAHLNIQKVESTQRKISGYRTEDCFAYEIWQDANSLYEDETVLRILAKNYSNQTAIGILSQGQLRLTECRRDGDYLVFTGPGSGTIVILEPVGKYGIWMGALLLLAFVCMFCYRKKYGTNKLSE